jgi:hypothetical protein
LDGEFEGRLNTDYTCADKAKDMLRFKNSPAVRLVQKGTETFTRHVAVIICPLSAAKLSRNIKLLKYYLSLLKQNVKLLK